MQQRYFSLARTMNGLDDLLPAVFGLLGALLGGFFALRAGDKQAKATSNAERSRRQDSQRVAGRVVELHLTAARDLLENALRNSMHGSWLATNFALPAPEDMGTLSGALCREEWDSLSQAVTELRYVRTLAQHLAASSAGDAAVPSAVRAGELRTDIERALAVLRPAVDMVERTNHGLATSHSTNGA